MVYATLEIIHLNQNQLNIVTLVVLQSLVLRIDVSEYSSFKTLLFKIIKFWLLECIKSASHHVFNRCLSFCFIKLKQTRMAPNLQLHRFLPLCDSEQVRSRTERYYQKRTLNQKRGSSGEMLAFITIFWL